ncbi:MAG: cell division protein CrgA [Micrococcales bacterium]
MPESKPRKDSAKALKVEPKLSGKAKANLPNPTWFFPVMGGFFLVGLAWILTYYISLAQYPLGAGVPALDIGAWNIGIGMGLVLVGFVMATRWK